MKNDIIKTGENVDIVILDSALKHDIT